MNYGWARDYALELINQYSIAGTPIASSYNNQADYIHRIPKLLDDAQVYAATTTGKIREIVTLSSPTARNTSDPILRGDVNGDGEINNADLELLRVYLANKDPITGESTVSVSTGADVNADGQINTMDLALLRKYLTDTDPVLYREEGAWRIYALPSNCWQVCSGGIIRFDGPRLQRFHHYHLLGNSEIAVPKNLDGALSLEYYRYPNLLGASPSDDKELDNSLQVQMALPYYVAAHLVMGDQAFAYSALYNEFETKLERIAERYQTEVNTIEDSYDAAEWLYNH